MKRLFFIIIIFIAAFSIASAQNAYREKGDIAIDASLGLPRFYSGFSVVLPPVSIDAEYTIVAEGFGVISAGLYAGYSLHKEKNSHVNANIGIVGPMASYRYILTPNIDLYSKLILGYYFFTTNDADVNRLVSRGGFGAGIYVGGTYYFSKHVGIGANVGYGSHSILNLQVTFKL